VVGKLLGRSAVVTVAVGVAFAVGAVVSLLVYGSIPFGSYVLTAGLTALLGLSFVGLSVGLSAATSTRTRAMAPAIGLVVLFGPLWQLVVSGISALADFGFSVQLSQETVRFLTVLSPADAYGRLFNSLVLPDLFGAGGGGLFGAQPVDTASAPVFLQDWFVLLLMVAWFVVPVTLGYLRFRAADLG
jgi:ABC-2 type transport system permease protein